MSTRVVDRVEKWDERSFAGGYRGLQQLTEGGFSGVVRAGGTELYMTRGVAVGVRGGDIEDFEGASGTAHQAPSAALPLLAVMQERSGAARDSFYTEQTPVPEVDRTLSEGGFTGYVELSENVLSGDYYIVYHAGQSTSVAFVGQSGRLVAGDDAFETAVDEVGIYEVYPAEVTPVDLPDPEPAEEPSGADHAAAGAGATESEAGEDRPANNGNTASGQSTGGDESSKRAERDEADGWETEGSPADNEGSEAQASGDPAAEPGELDGATADEQSGEPADATAVSDSESAEASADEGAETDDSESAEASADEGAAVSSDGETADASSTPDSETAGTPESAREPGDESQDTPDSAPAGVTAGPGSSDLEVLSIPSLEPGRTERPGRTETTGTGSDGAPEESADDGETATDSDERAASDESAGGERADEVDAGVAAASDDDGTAVDPERLEWLEARVGELEREREELREQLAAARSERDQLSAQLDSRDGRAGGRREVAPQNARSETMVFVRYRSQGGVTLDTVHGGGGSREALQENLQLEIYAGFDQPVAVDGRPYEAFVADTIAYRFAAWVVGALAFEIRETGNRKALRPLYDVLPEIDHVDLKGVVPIAVENRESESFDVVFRDQRERPLLVATIDNTHDPVTSRQMERLVTDAEGVGTVADSLKGAFSVTRSRFEGDALEVADEATKGRLLSRDSRKSFVSLSRKQGYHLCLVEMREEIPHLVVPEL